MKYIKIALFLAVFATVADYLELHNDCDGKQCTIAKNESKPTA